MRKEILDLMTTEEREVLLEAINASVILYHCLRNYDTELAYNILEDGNLEDRRRRKSSKSDKLDISDKSDKPAFYQKGEINERSS